MEKYVRVPIFPVTKYLTKGERLKIPAPMLPLSFEYCGDEIIVDRVVECDRGISLKVGGRGYWFECRVSWCVDDKWRTKNSKIWFDDFLQEWFVEVPESKAPADWHEATQLSDIQNFVDEFS